MINRICDLVQAQFRKFVVCDKFSKFLMYAHLNLGGIHAPPEIKSGKNFQKSLMLLMLVSALRDGVSIQ